MYVRRPLTAFHINTNINEKSIHKRLHVFSLWMNAPRVKDSTSRENSRSRLMTPKVRSMKFAEDVDELGLLTGLFFFGRGMRKGVCDKCCRTFRHESSIIYELSHYFLVPFFFFLYGHWTNRGNGYVYSNIVIKKKKNKEQLLLQKRKKKKKRF